MRVLVCTLSLVLAAVATPADAGTVFLSDYLGAPSGSGVNTDNPPYVSGSPWGWTGLRGLGVDTAGPWSGGLPIRFSDTGVFSKAIGAHPDSTIDFDLDAFRRIDPTLDTFSAVIGVDVSSRGSPVYGAAFTVLLDGVQVVSQRVAGTRAGSYTVTTSVVGASVLTLDTRYAGFPASSNHTAWADAKLTGAELVPLPGAAWMGLVLLAGVGLVRRRQQLGR